MLSIVPPFSVDHPALAAIPRDWLRRAIDLQPYPGMWVIPVRPTAKTEAAFIEEVLNTTFVQRGVAGTRSGDLLFNSRTLYALMRPLLIMADDREDLPLGFQMNMTRNIRLQYDQSPVTCKLEVYVKTLHWLMAWQEALYHWPHYKAYGAMDENGRIYVQRTPQYHRSTILDNDRALFLVVGIIADLLTLARRRADYNVLDQWYESIRQTLLSRHQLWYSNYCGSAPTEINLKLHRLRPRTETVYNLAQLFGA